MGVFRYNLLGIEVMIRRGLVYGLLAAIVLAGYLLVAEVVGTSTQLGSLSVVATAAVIAVALAPLRERLQRGLVVVALAGTEERLLAVGRIAGHVDRQLVLAIQDGVVVRILNASSGKPSTPTPPGSYAVYGQFPRWWSVPFREWLPWAIPFIGGYAFHEFQVVPAYPASHGCVRQSYTVARWTYAFATVGMPVKVIAKS